MAGSDELKCAQQGSRAHRRVTDTKRNGMRGVTVAASSSDVDDCSQSEAYSTSAHVVAARRSIDAVCGVAPTMAAPVHVGLSP